MKTLLNLFLSMSLMFNCRASLQRSHTLSTIEEVDENLEIKLECIDNVKQYLAEQNPDGTRNVRLIFGVSANEEDIKRFDENSENYINIFLDQHKSCDDPRQLAIDAGKLNHNIDLLLSFKKTFDVVTFDFSTTKMFLHSWTTDYLSIIKDSLKKNGKLIIPFDSNY